MRKFPISESFLSFQGEGVHAGRRAYFVRLFGCNVKCQWCDSKNAWATSANDFLTAYEIADAVQKSHAEIVVITGGEPCLHDLSELLRELKARSIAVHLETSGTLPIRECENCKFDWVALSPKLFYKPLVESLKRADELKFIVSNISEIAEYEKFAECAVNANALWLHPEWSQSGDKKLLGNICDFVAERGGRWRAGWQMHKNYFAR